MPDEYTAIGAADMKVLIPGGTHEVLRHSLSDQVRLGSRQVKLTLAEFERLLGNGCARLFEVDTARPPDLAKCGVEAVSESLRAVRV